MRRAIALRGAIFSGYYRLFCEPCPQIDQPTAFAAEGTKGGSPPVEQPPAGRTLDAPRTHGGSSNAQAQQLSTKLTSACACVGRLARPFQVRKRTLQR